MRIAAAVLMLLVATGRGYAQNPGERPQEMDKAVGDAVTQPLTDANLKRREIPPELIAIRDDPYSLAGISTCRDIIAAVTRIDTALGTDFDRVAPQDRDRTGRRAARVAGGVIGGLIPFRGVIREISGANKADEDYRYAIYAGAVRRGFLKGYGQARRCAPPGRPLTAAETAREAALMMAQDGADRASREAGTADRQR